MHRKKPFQTMLLSGMFLFLVTDRATAQTITRSFDGDSGPGAAVCEQRKTHCGFPDMDAGVNGKQVVQVTWQNFGVYDLNGKLIKSIPLDTFIRNAGLDPIPTDRKNPPVASKKGAFEGHVVYNEFLDRWIVSATGSSDSLLVSASADALGSWGGVNLSCLESGPCLNFDPALHLGYDKNGVYYCGGHLGESSPNTIIGVAYDCFAIPAAEVKAIAQGKAPAHINRMHSLPHEIFPAIDHTPDKAAGAPALFLSKTCDRSTPGGCQNATNNSFHWIVDTYTWKGVTGTGTWNADGEQLVKTDVGSKQNKWLYNKPCCGPLATFPQAGTVTPLRAAESHRLTNAVQHGSHLHGVLSSGPCVKDCGVQGTDTNNVGFWVDLDCSNPKACVVSQTAKIAGDFNPEFPTIGVDKAGNVGIVAISSTAKTNLSILLWTHKVSDPPNSVTGPTTVVAGTEPYTCETDKQFASIANPVGVFTALDPADGSKLWVSHHYARSAERCVWNTRIFQYQIVPLPGDSTKQSKSKSAKQP